MPSSSADRMRRRLVRAAAADPYRKYQQLDGVLLFGEDEVSIVADENMKMWYKRMDLEKGLEIDKPTVEDKKYCRSYKQLMKNVPKDCSGIHPKTAFVNEMGFFRFIARSPNPKAKNFMEWVFGKVLPSICMTDKFEVHPANNPLRELKAFIILRTEEEVKNRNAETKHYTKNE